MPLRFVDLTILSFLFSGAMILTFLVQPYSSHNRMRALSSFLVDTVTILLPIMSQEALLSSVLASLISVLRKASPTLWALTYFHRAHIFTTTFISVVVSSFFIVSLFFIYLFFLFLFLALWSIGRNCAQMKPNHSGKPTPNSNFKPTLNPSHSSKTPE